MRADTLMAFGNRSGRRQGGRVRSAPARVRVLRLRERLQVRH